MGPLSENDAMFTPTKAKADQKIRRYNSKNQLNVLAVKLHQMPVNWILNKNLKIYKNMKQFNTYRITWEQLSYLHAIYPTQSELHIWKERCVSKLFQIVWATGINHCLNRISENVF